jgi:hypothetical protein
MTANVVSPRFRGSDDDEGAIYGPIFLDFARRTTLTIAVEAHSGSQAISFGQYKSWVHISICPNMPLT